MGTRTTSKQLEHKAFSLKLDGPPDDTGHFTGYAAVFSNVDLGNDVIDPGAFTKTLQETPSVTILWAHDTDEPIGIAASMVEDKRGLKVEGQLALDVQRAREVHSLMKLGAVKGLSIGYNVVKRQFKGQVRHLQELKLGEFSLCVFPMNPEANVDDVKQGKDIEMWNPEADRILWMIGAGSDFMAALVNGAEYGLAEGVQATIESLAENLFATVAEDQVELSDDEQAAVAKAISSAASKAIATLEALRISEPADDATRKDDVAAPAAAKADVTEPDVSTLRALIADMQSAA